MSDSHTLHVPDGLVQMDISSAALRLWLLLKKFANRSLRAWPSTHTLLAYLPGWDGSTLRRAARILKKNDLLSVDMIFDESTGAQKRNVYVLKYPPFLKKFAGKGGPEQCARGEGNFARGGRAKLSGGYIYGINSCNRELKKDRRSAAKTSRAPTRSPDRDNQTQESKKLLDHMAGVYLKIKGQPMRTAPRHLAIVAGVARAFRPAGAKALWDVWWRKGPWATFAHSSGHSVEAWDRCIDRLVDAPEYKEFLETYEEN